MKKTIITIIILAVAGYAGYRIGLLPYFEVVAAPPLPITNDVSLVGVFASHIPCDPCYRTKLFVILYQDPITKQPTTYGMERVGVGEGNTRHIYQGKWTITKGTKQYPDAEVYQFDENAPKELRSFWAVNNDLLHILDNERNPLVGFDGESYTINRIQLEDMKE